MENKISLLSGTTLLQKLGFASLDLPLCFDFSSGLIFDVNGSHGYRAFGHASTVLLTSTDDLHPVALQICLKF